MVTNAVRFLQSVTILQVQIFYVGEFSFHVYWYFEPKTHEVKGKMYVDHESTALTSASASLPVANPYLVKQRGFATREEFGVYAKKHRILKRYNFNWDKLEKRYNVGRKQDFAET